MRKFMLMTVMAVLVGGMAGCWTPKFDKFVTQPKDMVGWGVDNSWMWQDASKLGNTMVKNGINCTSIDVYGCNKVKNPQGATGGYWYDHFSDLKPYLDTFLDAMKKRRITVHVTMMGWNFKNMCAAQYNTDWYNKELSYFVERGTEGLILEPAAEPLAARNRQCDAKYYQFVNLLNQRWSGLKDWNGGARPQSAPAGYFIKYHPMNTAEACPPNSIIITDSPVGGQISYGSYMDKIKLIPEKAGPYIKRLHQQGKGFIFYGWCFNGDWVDEDGMKLIRESAK